jgi:hypothetical protein
MLAISPALERALTFTSTATLILLTQYQTPEQIRAAGRDGLIAHLRRNRALHTAKVAEAALTAAAGQTIGLPAQDTAAALTADLAAHLLQLRQRIKATDKAIEDGAGPIRSPPSCPACPAWDRW